MAHLSVIAPIGKALQTVRRAIFSPFEPLAWLALAFTAWLDALPKGGFPPLGLGLSLSLGPPVGPLVRNWVCMHRALFVVMAGGMGVVSLAAGLVLLWVRCRGAFLFLDNVRGGRAEIRAPWIRFRREGHSLFLFSAAFAAVVLAVLAVTLLALLAAAWPGMSRAALGARAVGALLAGGLFLLCFGLAVLGIQALLHDFVVPLMALRQCGVMAAWATVLALFKAHAAAFGLYLLFRLALGLGLSIVLLGCCCLGCGVVLIPYVGAVILLPLLVFWRAYSLHFLEQFGPAYRLFETGSAHYIPV